MPPPVKHDDCVILFDLNVSDEFFLKARECLLDIYGNKWCSESRDYVCLLPFGGSEIDEDGAFDNYNPSDVQRSIVGVEKNDGRIVSALLRAVKNLETRHNGLVSGKGLYTRQLLCISDFNKNTFVDANDIVLFRELVAKLNRMKAYLYIFGPEVVYSNEILMHRQDMRRWIKNPVFAADENENENLQMVKRLVQAVDRAVVCDLKMGVSILGHFKRWAGPQPCLIPLTLGDNKLQFTNRDWRCLRRLSFMKLETEYVNRFNCTYVLAANPEVVVENENVVRAIRAGNKMITMAQHVRDEFKPKGERCFDLLGFTQRSLVPAHLFIGDGTHATLPSGLYDEWTMGLIRVLKEKDLVGIAAKRMIRNTRAKFCALIPSDNCRWLYVVQLPFGNHMRKRCTAKTPSATNADLDRLLNPHEDNPSPPAHQADIYNYLDSMELTGRDMPVNVTMSPNPQFKRWWRFAVQKCTGLEMNCEEKVLGKEPSLINDEPLKPFWIERDIVAVEDAASKADGHNKNVHND